MHLQLARHATLLVTYGNFKFLVDPMLSDVGANPPIPNTPNELRNPLVPLALPIPELLDVDAYLITHTHRDHFDEAAAELLPKHIPLFCQPQDTAKFHDLGFVDVRPIEEGAVFHNEISISRTSGQHGTGAIALAMAPVSGFVLQARSEPTLYIAGDTIWCPSVRDALDQYHPDFIVVNAGGARFNSGDPITMTDVDIEAICHHLPPSTIIAVHLDSINHCLQTRFDLHLALANRQLLDRVLIPADGDNLEFLQK